MFPAGRGRGREAKSVHPAPSPGPFLRCSAGERSATPGGTQPRVPALASEAAKPAVGKGAEHRSCRLEPRAGQKPRRPLVGPMGQGSKPGRGKRETVPSGGEGGVCPSASETYEPELPVCLSASPSCDSPCPPHHHQGQWLALPCEGAEQARCSCLSAPKPGSLGRRNLSMASPGLPWPRVYSGSALLK